LKTFPTLLLILFFGVFALTGQSIPKKGVPLLESFSPADYHNKGKVWEITSTPNGIIYCAADGGLLEFDGKTWNSFTGSTGFTRSVLALNDSLIYTGSDLDFGVWIRNRNKQFEYTSLYPFREEAYDISEEFWRIHTFQNNILFVSSRNIYVFRNEQLIKIAAPSFFTGSFKVNEDLYFTDRNNGLFVFDDFSLRKVLDLPDVVNPVISGVFQKDDDLIIVTRDLGLYVFSSGQLSRLENELSEKLSEAKVFSFEQIGSSHLAFGTVLKGLYIADMDGTIIHHINRHKGLPSNTVLALHYAPNGKLWLGMDYGIISLDLKSNFTTFFDYRGDFGTGYTAVLKDGIFYLGTNQGLYISGWEELNNDAEFFRFQLIPGTEGQVWALVNIDNTLFMGHDKGLFIIKGKEVEMLNDQDGVWTIIPYRDFLLTGNYNGISIFQRAGNTWSFKKKMDLILGSCNQLVIENENILWVNIPNFGIIRAILDKDLNPIERLIFTKNIFEKEDVFIIKDDSGIHFATRRNQYVFDTPGNNFIKIDGSKTYPKVDGLLPGVFHPVSIHPDYDFYPVFNGFALRYLAAGEPATEQNFSLVVRKMEAFSNHEREIIYPGVKVSSNLNNIHIQFIVPNQNYVLYQYKLGESGTWSKWGENNSVDFLNLRHGEYQFFARALVNDSVIEKQPITFSIATPWHFAWYAYVSYFLILGLIVWGIYSWQSISLKKQKKQMLIREKKSLHHQTEKHKREIMLLEQKRLQAEYDQLKQQLKSKTIELAKKARDNEEKNRLLLTLKEKCEKAQQNPALFDIKWGEMQRILDSYLKIEDKTFEIQMDELHQEFFKKLKENFPDLSNNDLRLCAYLKIGLNSKEIAEILNIQPSSFYISRSRLRKKLNLKTEEDLYSFLNEV
jgi:AraC family transcriptional regulator, chitin signaling transcriptional activator